jgi:hypothetical protein
MKKIRITKKSINRIHRLTGLFVCLFLIHLAITGMLLNHSEDLNLDESYLSGRWLLGQYNLSVPEAEEVFVIDDLVISKYGPQVFLGATPVFKSNNPILGVIKNNGIIILAFQDRLVLLTLNGILIEKMGQEVGVPPFINKIGILKDNIYINANDQLWKGNYSMENWSLTKNTDINWSQQRKMPEKSQKVLKQYFTGQGVSLEQFILDLHNGKIIRYFGKELLDIVGLLLLILSVSGFWIWLKRRP